MIEPRYDAIHFLDGWTGRAWYLGSVYLCGPRPGVEHGRHATEAEAIACIKGEWQPNLPLESAAQRNRREARGRFVRGAAETPPLAPQGGSGRSDRPTVPAVSQARGRRPRSVLRPGPPTVPPRTGHPASCKHGWCYCHDVKHAEEADASRMAGVDALPCRICRTEEFNRTRRPS